MEETQQITCPSCAKTLKMKASVIGKRVRCPACQNVFLANEDETVLTAPAKATRPANAAVARGNKSAATASPPPQQKIKTRPAPDAAPPDAWKSTGQKRLESPHWKNATRMTFLIGWMVVIVCVIGPIIQAAGTTSILADQSNQRWAKSVIGGNMIVIMVLAAVGALMGIALLVTGRMMRKGFWGAGWAALILACVWGLISLLPLIAGVLAIISGEMTGAALIGIAAVSLFLCSKQIHHAIRALVSPLD